MPRFAHLLAAMLSLSPAAFTLATAAPAGAASFDCSRARLADEKAICNHLSLNDQDVRMSQLYDIARRFVGMGERGAIMDRQATWLKQRHACGSNTACLARAYATRIGELNPILERAYRHAPL